ncbi:MGH1-like glycoside hydrolase domain-containing protein [Lichenihabitans psoromatis]|uniref:MGH1-like glycoside hydrolase domain-containing protein n=1 Tax=Lichenihabitans psoromatis TaxID=2528642 RepID=UPI00103621FC|nr:trehalase family glycosidase [Lichenihabitans psoromatis]
MLRHATLAPSRAWYTWSSRPAEMVFLPLGVRVTPVAFAGSVGRASLFPPGESVLFGRHDLQGSHVGLELRHAGTVLDWTYRKHQPFAVAGAWHGRTLGEWGLRFWINLCLSSEDGSRVHYRETQGAAVVKVGHRFVALVTRDAPVQVTGHDSVEAVAADYEANGYFHLASRATDATVIALRFNLEMMRDGAFAAAVADREDLAIEQARAALASAQSMPTAAQTGRFAGALDAMRDVMAWNTVWDTINTRPYTSISRNWNQAKFGGFGVWLNDQHYAALMTAMLDPEVGHENLDATLASATPQGNFACLLTANDAWVDRTQLPVASFLVWLMYRRSGSKPLLRLMVDSLSRNHAWWWANRDPGSRGLCSFGTSDVGEGLYKGTSFGSRNESSMDNSPIHDEAPYDPETRTLASMDVGLNSLLALDAEILALIAAELGDSEGATGHAARAEATREKIRSELWDASRQIFANRLWTGAFVRSVGPTSFYPLVSGAPTLEQTEALLNHLADPATFGGDIVIPSVSRDDPAFGDNTYWRGRVWPPLNYWVWQGLRRNGRYDEASHLAQKSFALFETAWARRLCPENYNAVTGEPLDQPDTEGFYGWGALIPLMAVGEIMDVSPWRGWEITNTGEPMTLGPLESPVGAISLAVADGTLSLRLGETLMLETNLRGRLTHLRIEPGRVSFVLPDTIETDAFLRLPQVRTDRLILAQVGADAMVASGETVRFDTIAPAAAGQRIDIVWHG